jgi:hypothetical protein
MNRNLRLRSILDEGASFGRWKTFGLTDCVDLDRFYLRQSLLSHRQFHGNGISLAALFGEVIIYSILRALLTPTSLGLTRRYPVTGEYRKVTMRNLLRAGRGIQEASGRSDSSDRFSS